MHETTRMLSTDEIGRKFFHPKCQFSHHKSPFPAKVFSEMYPSNCLAAFCCNHLKWVALDIGSYFLSLSSLLSSQDLPSVTLKRFSTMDSQAYCCRRHRKLKLWIFSALHSGKINSELSDKRQDPMSRANANISTLYSAAITYLGPRIIMQGDVSINVQLRIACK
jgi:hypothetical protein